MLTQLQTGLLNEALILWQPKHASLVLPSGNKWHTSEDLKMQLKGLGWQLYSRKTGGAPVPQLPGVINVSHMYVWNDNEPYSITVAYEAFCTKLTSFFAQYDVDVSVHATPGSYCDGDYNLNIAGQKVVGTAQRVVLKQGGGKVVLAQACILVDVNVETITLPVNLCYSYHNLNERVISGLLTCLREHCEKDVGYETHFQRLITSFSP